MQDAFRLTLREFDRRRWFLNDQQREEGWWETTEGVAERKYRDEFDEQLRLARIQQWTDQD